MPSGRAMPGACRHVAPLASVTRPFTRPPHLKAQLDEARGCVQAARVFVLIVDDHPDSNVLMSEFFRMHGFRTAQAEDGEAAMRQALATPPDVILLDLEMPVLGGEGFRARQLREPAVAHVPVVCVSGRYDAEERAGRLGLTCFIKPVPLDRLLAEVQRLGAGTRHGAGDRRGP